MASIEPKDNGRFKLPGSSLDEVFKVIQGYANVVKLASLADVSKNTGMHVTAISKNVGFLLSLGILEGGKNKAATEIGRRLGLALMHNVPEEVESILATLVAENEFLKNILAAVRIRKGMDESSLRAHIAYSAGQSKTGATTTGTGAVVELLKRSGHLSTEDGKFVVGSPIARSPSETTVQERTTSPATSLETVSHTIGLSQSPFSISIKIEVRCEPNDLDTLGAKLRKLIDDFSGQEAADAGQE